MAQSIPSFYNEDSTFLGLQSIQSPERTRSSKKPKTTRGPSLSFLNCIHKTAGYGEKQETYLLTQLETKETQLKEKDIFIHQLKIDKEKLEQQINDEKNTKKNFDQA